ncbi:MAG: exo-alpha-sialidase [Pirellulaceae bacterium]|nr:exo-alpha-sialidase [Pirellulaceae bacterium]
MIRLLDFGRARSMRMAGLLCIAAMMNHAIHVSAADLPRVIVNVVEGGESSRKPEEVLSTVVGPGVNQPDHYLGYGGFVGWVSPIRLRQGDWLLGFSAGYWHASAPTPLRFSPGTIAEYQKMGLPKDIDAPTGGVAMIMRSSDEGKTWSKPAVMLDTPVDDRHPAFVEPHGPDGMLICSVFTYPGGEPSEYVKDPKLAHRTAIIRSFDYGKTWDKEVIRLPSPFLSDETNGPMILLKDGSILLTVSGTPKEGGPSQAAFFISQDRGSSWKLLSTLKADHNLDEANATQLPDGRLVMMARPEGDISWSSDEGKTWSPPVTFGMRLYAPSLYALRDGTLVSLHGSYTRGGLRIIFSKDGGHTWIAPAKDHGFLVDNCYAYGKAFELPDGTLLIADQGTGGHTAADAKSMSLRLLRVRIRADHSGIDLLPASSR